MRKNVQQTSIESYRGLKPIGDRCQTTLVFIHAYPNSTDYELATFMGHEDPNIVRPRRNELVKMGLVVCSGKRKCTITQKMSLIWKVKTM